MARWGNEPWNPSDDDRKAAGKLHIQIASRITTQRLGYLDGVEKTALESVFVLFQRLRDIGDALPECRHFDAIAWDVLNSHVRPFTAKWHRQSQRGALSALDATDEFRAELSELHPVLRRFDDLLLQLRDNCPPPPRADDDGSGKQDAVAHEMTNARVPWGIPLVLGGVDEKTATSINEAEQNAIRARRRHYGFDPNNPRAVALALSGGGIRSATFSLGVLIALARRGVLPHFDYMSTVSGGGYLGSFLSAFLNSPRGDDIGLQADDLPFRRRAGEAAALRHLRHHSKYLVTGSLWERVKMACAQLFGMALNGLAIVFVITGAVVIERVLRALAAHLPEGTSSLVSLGVAGVFAVCWVVALVAVRFGDSRQRLADALVAGSTMAVLALLAWHGLDSAHEWFRGARNTTWTWLPSGGNSWIAIAGAIPVVMSALTSIFGRVLKRAGIVLVVLSALAAPIFLFGVYLTIYEAGVVTLALIVIVGASIYGFGLYDINVSSPHRHYRRKLAEAYLIQQRDGTTDEFDSAVSIRLSALSRESNRGPYHLLNGALNVPGSANSAMQGRFTDFFLFSSRYCGSPLTGYQATESWEMADAHLDLGTAMAVSGAAAAPQMGLGTMKRFSFWLGLLNVRLGYWVRKPSTAPGWRSPGLGYLLQEMLGSMDEKRPWLNVSDGGHIENLGVYELLRRRCQYIVAIDGEEDAKMTFHALTTLQRMAAIDLGVRIDIDLDDLRLNEQGLSRSHFRFCRVRYPRCERDSEEDIGYLLYIKLSLTGNEGEFIRRHRLDDPAFPHDSTADQFFSEAQFEAYRSLGEHVGDKLFLRTIIGDLADERPIEVERWFCELGKRLLEPLPAASRTRGA